MHAFESALHGATITGLNGFAGSNGDSPAPVVTVLQHLAIGRTTWWLLAFRSRTALQLSEPGWANDIALFQGGRLVWTFPLRKSWGLMSLPRSTRALSLAEGGAIQVRFDNTTMGGSGGTTNTFTDMWNPQTGTMTTVRENSNHF